MSRVTPDSTPGPDLKDFEPYGVTLASLPTIGAGGAEWGSKPRAELTWRLDGNEDPDDTLKDWAGITLKPTTDGAPSKLSELLNALAGKPATTKVAWFDDVTFEWGYETDGAAFSRLCEGLPATIRGKKKLNKKNELRFRIETYQPAGSGTAAAAAVAPQPFTESFLQISPDGKYGWNGQAWIAIPQAIPPPPPSSPIPPPPPAADDANPDEIPF